MHIESCILAEVGISPSQYTFHVNGRAILIHDSANGVNCATDLC